MDTPQWYSGLNRHMMKQHTLFLLLALSAVTSCSLEVNRNPYFDTIAGPAFPCSVEEDTTFVIVEDYFPHIGRVDKVCSDDYEIICLSKSGMDSVLLVGGDSFKKISVLQVFSGREHGALVLKKSAEMGGGVPVMTATGPLYEPGTFNVSVENSPASYVVLWQNTVLDHKFLSHKRSGVFTVRIPENAKDIENSCVRVFAYNSYGVGKELTVPVHYGEVMIN